MGSEPRFVHHTPNPAVGGGSFQPQGAADLFETGSEHSEPKGTAGMSQAGVYAVSSVTPLLKTILGEAVKRHSPPTFSGEPKEFPAW